MAGYPDSHEARAAISIHFDREAKFNPVALKHRPFHFSGYGRPYGPFSLGVEVDLETSKGCWPHVSGGLENPDCLFGGIESFSSSDVGSEFGFGMSKQPLPKARHRSRTNSEGSSSPVMPETETMSFMGAGSEMDRELTTPDYPYPVPATLFPGEDVASFQSIQDYFQETIDPEPGVEAMLVNSIVDHVREIRQLEKARTVLVRLAVADDLAVILRRSVTRSDEITGGFLPEIAAKQWALGANWAQVEVRRRLSELNMVEDDLLRNGYALALDQLDRLSALIERAERRRDRVLKTFEQMRALQSLVELRNLQVRRANSAFIEHEFPEDRNIGSPSDNETENV